LRAGVLIERRRPYLLEVLGRGIRIQGRLLRIARLDADKYKFLDNPEEMIKELRSCGERIDLFTFMQGLPATEPKYSYPMEWDNLAVLPVSTFDNWWKNQIGQFPRNRARQAGKRGAVVQEVAFDENLVRGIREVYNECPIRQGRKFSHFGEDYETVYREEATYLDSSIFIGVYFGGQLIGFVKLVVDETGKQANLMNILSMIRHRDKAPTNALIAEAVRVCAARGIQYLVYSNFAYGKKQQSSLSDFKERNGFKRVDLPRYFVPLTRGGAMAFRLGMHHKLVDHVPEPMLAYLYKLRSAWYGFKYSSAIEAS
jgi:hypothetical protein